MTTKEVLDLITWAAAIGSYAMGLITIVLVLRERRRPTPRNVALMRADEEPEGKRRPNCTDAPGAWGSS